MSELIEQILDTLEIVKARHKVDPATPIKKLRRDAEKQVAHQRNVYDTTVSNKYRRGLNPPITNTEGFDRRVDLWLRKGSGELQDILLRYSKTEDEKRISKLFSATQAPPAPVAEDIEEPHIADRMKQQPVQTPLKEYQGNAKIVKRLAPAEIKYGYLYHHELSHHFPTPSQAVTIIDSDGKRFRSKVHSSQPRIDRLTKLYRKYKLQAGQAITIYIKSGEAATAHFLFGHNPTKNIERAVQTTGLQIREQGIRSGAGFGNPITNRKVEKAAIKLVSRQYIDRGWNVRSVEVDKCGYDLLCRKGAVEEHVEVKGIQGEVQSFVITTGEIHQAEKSPHFIICVVTSALSKQPLVDRYTGVEFINKFDLEPSAYRASLRKSS